jgi:hypothetical protein
MKLPGSIWSIGFMARRDPAAGDLQVQGTEVPVGNFSIDILVRDIEGHVVVIENQCGGFEVRMIIGGGLGGELQIENHTRFI